MAKPEIIVPAVPGQAPHFVEHRTGLLVPPDAEKPVITTAPFTTTLIPASDQDVLRYSNRIPEEATLFKTRSSSELARASFNPRLFLAIELQQELPHGELFKEVISNLRSDVPHATFSYDAMHRTRQTVEAFDKTTGEKFQQEITTPGALESAGIVITNLLAEPCFKTEATRIVVAPLANLVKEYRLHRRSMQETPEMPDLIANVLNHIDVFTDQPQTRFALYGILEQITIPDSMRESILEQMDYHGDLDHPLAFQLTLQEAKRENSPWIAEQEERRTALLERLSAPNQDLFDEYDKLLAVSRGLVYSGNVRNPRNGKVGLEIEFIPHERGKDSIRNVKSTKENLAMSKHYFKRGRGIEDVWAVHIDPHRYYEVTRADNSLAYGKAYEESLVKLYKWFGDNAQTLDAFHIHLDRQEHPFLPKLGGIYEGYDLGRMRQNGGYTTVLRNTVDRSYRNYNKTWEIRPVALPKGVGNMHPGRLADVVGLYTGASNFENTTDNLAKITVTEPPKSINQLLWGHMTTFIQDPEIRLAVLMTLHDENALRYCNPLAFFHTYTQESLETIATLLKPLLPYESDQEMLRILAKIGAKDTFDLLQDLSDMDRKLVREILGNKTLAEFSEYDYMLLPNRFSWAHDHKEMLTTKYGYKPRFPRRRTETEGVFDRDQVVAQIRRDAQVRVVKTQEKLSATQTASENEEERKKRHSEAFQKALRFDKAFFDFIRWYTFDMCATYSMEEMKMMTGDKKAWKAYSNEKRQYINKFFHMYVALNQVSDALHEDLMEEKPVNFDKAFSFDEDAIFENQAQQIYADLATVADETPQGEAKFIKRVHKSTKNKIMMHLGKERVARKRFTPAATVLLWAQEHGIKDERLKPVKEIMQYMYYHDNLPRGYEILLTNGFLGMKLENNKKSPVKMGNKEEE